ncbi:MAG: LysR family transcriptional regulator [Saccharospirillaceae bacterium]|nr:LysR family transcriptional regulator [Pseudomonadales bacterium]NRB80917.1 LysR family transcriptional regulator [Saccharospirillaceae bacterium]
MKIEQLKMLKTVAQLGTLKAASEKLFKTQAAISKGIKQLENQLGLELFDRKAYRMILTDEGEQILQLAKIMLDKAVEIENLSQHLNAGNEATITIAINSAFDLNLILPMLENIQNTFPDTQLIIHQEQISGALHALTQNKADFAITVVVDEYVKQQQFDLVFLTKGEMINVAAPKLIARHNSIKQQRTLEKEYQIVIQDSGNQNKSQTFGIQDGQRCWYVNDFTSKKTIITSGLGWGNLPGHMIQNELNSGELIALNFEDQQPTGLNLKGQSIQTKFDYFALKQKQKLLGPVATKIWQSLNAL